MSFLSVVRDNGPKSEVTRPAVEVPFVSVAAVRAIIESRRARADFFENGDLFSDPAWDILLELYAIDLEQRKHTVGSLCRSVAVPPTSVVRWLKALESENLVIRWEDHLDARRVFVKLSDQGRASLDAYFSNSLRGI
jgi:DNA-binding MarR family transcriptional regulator